MDVESPTDVRSGSQLDQPACSLTVFSRDLGHIAFLNNCFLLIFGVCPYVLSYMHSPRTAS